jgi:DNA-binding NarL/FixJ family response regulator
MRILVADNQVRVQRALAVMMKEWPRWEIVGNAANTGETLSRTASLKPDVLILDWDLAKGIHGDLLETLRHMLDNLLIIGTSANPENHHAALALGIDYFYCKVDPLHQLLAILADCDSRMAYNSSPCRLPILRS